ncbi:MAG: hypothetical protein NC412_10415 [Roseburia sp.]|nr:hypothetical protein [Roseburia sp.]MCM1279765.1 hypothetical protein [Robinsoniella sp.]
MKRKKDFIFMTVVLFLVAVSSFAGTAYSQSADTYGLKDCCLKEQEQECLLRIKTVLKEYHCEESGVTMTKTIDRKGNRQYRIVIHHKKLKEMDSAKKEKLKKDLENIGFYQRNFSISYEFLL